MPTIHDTFCLSTSMFSCSVHFFRKESFTRNPTLLQHGSSYLTPLLLEGVFLSKPTYSPRPLFGRPSFSCRDLMGRGGVVTKELTFHPHYLLYCARVESLRSKRNDTGFTPEWYLTLLRTGRRILSFGWKQLSFRVTLHPSFILNTDPVLSVVERVGTSCQLWPKGFPSLGSRGWGFIYRISLKYWSGGVGTKPTTE